MDLDKCEFIFNTATTSKSEYDFYKSVEPLFDKYEIISIELGRGTIFWRARIIEDEIYKNLREIDYPPPEFAKQGRLNDRNQPCFYIATRPETALAEVNAQEGQNVQVAGFRIGMESTVRLAVIGEYSNVQKNGYMHFTGKDPQLSLSQMLNSMPREEAMLRLYIDRFFAHILRDPNASTNGYLLTRSLGKIIHSRVPIDGIVFPSIKDKGGFNIAIKAKPSDEKFLNVCCILATMGKKRQFGLIDYTIKKTAHSLDDKWNFVWHEDEHPEIMGMYNMNKDEYNIASSNINDRNAMLKMLHQHNKSI